MHYIELATVALIFFFFHFKVIVLSPGPYPFINTAAHSSGETSRETSSSTEWLIQWSSVGVKEQINCYWMFFENTATS